MSIRRLQTLVAISESRSFLHAAEKMHLTPAAVGHQMKILESEIGLKLFDRSQRAPRLNPQGQSLVPKARAIIQDYGNLSSSLKDKSKPIRNIRIGAVNTTMAGLIPQVLLKLREQYQHIHLQIIPGLSGELLPQVDRGSLDAAVISEPSWLNSRLRWLPFAEEPLEIIAPLDAGSDQPQKLLTAYPYIRFDRSAWVGSQIDEWLIKHKIEVNETMELTTLESISSMVSHGLGASIVPRQCVPSIQQFQVKHIPLGEGARFRKLGVLFRKDNCHFEEIEILLEALARTVKDNAPT